MHSSIARNILIFSSLALIGAFANTAGAASGLKPRCTIRAIKKTDKSAELEIRFSESVKGFVSRDIRGGSVAGFRAVNGKVGRSAPQGGASRYRLSLSPGLASRAASVLVPANRARGTRSRLTNRSCAIRVRFPAVPAPEAKNTPTGVSATTDYSPPDSSKSSPTGGGVSPSSCSGTEVNGESSLPVFPQAQGHGTRTVAGSGRNFSRPCTVVYKVSSLEDSGPGSLRECVEASGPRACIFEVGGIIKLSKKLAITNPYITIAGQTAPFSGVILRGGSIIVSTSDVLIQHVISRVGDDNGGQEAGSRDGANTFADKGDISNVVFDHVSIAWSLDEGWSVAPYKGDVSNVTFSHSIVASGLDMSVHPDASNPDDKGHSKATLINSDNTVKNLSYHHNLLAHNADRNIRIAVPIALEYINNLVYDWGRGSGSARTIELANGRKALHTMDLIGNNYIPGPDSMCPGTQYENERCGGSTDDPKTTGYMVTIPSSDLNEGSRYFIHDNMTNTRWDSAQDDWSVAGPGFFSNMGALKMTYAANRAESPVASSGTVNVLPAAEAKEYVLEHSGARPKERDAVDVETVNDVRNGTGGIINCVGPDGSERCAKNAGGWPLYPAKQRKLDLPADPNGDSNGNGYTNLEEWLFQFSAGLE